MKKTLAEIAEAVGGRLADEKDGALLIEGVTNIDNARGKDITFSDDKHLEEAAECAAEAVILPKGVGDFKKPAVYVGDVRAAFATLLTIFTPPLVFKKGVDEKAHIGADVKIGKDVTIMPFAVVDDHAVIGDNVTLYPHTYIGQYTEVGDDTVIYSSATVREHCKVGKRVIIHSSAVIGADGFGFTTANGVHTKVPQVGGVAIEDDVEIGAHVGIDRATAGMTVIGHGTKIDNLVHIGHNCHIGANCLIVAQTGISGSTIVGDNVTFGGQVGTVGHINIGGNSVYAARSGIIGDMPEGVFCAGFPVQPHQEWLRMQALQRRLPQLLKRLRDLEKTVEELESKAK
ncbi:MAG: UDP-3-O-(3-hydroxymyristoyl)glucosamine N-acyltransferase [Selenomonadaceae bacterium]